MWILEARSSSLLCVVFAVNLVFALVQRGADGFVTKFAADGSNLVYSTYISGTVKPGESRYFKIACGCKDSPPAAHDSFKVHVRGGF